MDELANCTECGSLFVKTVISLCDECYQAKERRFDKVNEFLRKKENKNSTILETAAHTGVTEMEILEFIRQGRLLLKDFPHFYVLCSFCGQETRNGKLCKTCERQLQDDISDVYNTKETHRDRAYVNKELHSRHNE